MAILDWFSKKQDRTRKDGDVRAHGKEQGPKNNAVLKSQTQMAKDDAQKQVSSSSARTMPTLGQIAGRAILRGAHITEKSTAGQQYGKYVFDIFPEAQSSTVKYAVQNMYKVHVQNVQIVKARPQKRRRGRFVSMYRRPNKAIVTLRKGETIDVMA